MRQSMGRVALTLALAALVAAPAFADSTWSTVDIQRTHSWQAPSGAPDYLEWSRDGSRLLVLGTGGPRTVQVLDRELDPVATVEAPFDVRGATWSASGRLLMAWGPGAVRDGLAFWDVPSFAANSSVVPRELLGLATITAARLFVDDVILLVAGRDADGVSRMCAVEVPGLNMVQNLTHPYNRTVLSIWDTGRPDILCIEEGGYVHSFSGNDWDRWMFQTGPSGRITASDFEYRHDWLVGDANGVVRTLSIFNGTPSTFLEHGSGPVQGLAQLQLFSLHTFLAFPGAEGGSVLQVWRQMMGAVENVTEPVFVREFNFTSPITTILDIPGDWGNLTVGHADGTVEILHVNGTVLRTEDEVPGPPDDDGDGNTTADGNGTGDGDGTDGGGRTWWTTWGYLVVLVALAGALAPAYAWLARREGRGG